MLQLPLPCQLALQCLRCVLLSACTNLQHWYWQKLLALVCADGGCLQLVPEAQAGLTAGESVKNPRALLRYALPIQNKEVRQLQVCHFMLGVLHRGHLPEEPVTCKMRQSCTPAAWLCRAYRAVQQDLEAITEELRVPGSKPIGPVQRVRSTADLLFVNFGPCMLQRHTSLRYRCQLYKNSPKVRDTDSWSLLQTVRKGESMFAQNRSKIEAAFAPQHQVCPVA